MAIKKALGKAKFVGPIHSHVPVITSLKTIEWTNIRIFFQLFHLNKKKKFDNICPAELNENGFCFQRDDDVDDGSINLNSSDFLLCVINVQHYILIEMTADSI